MRLPTSILTRRQIICSGAFILATILTLALATTDLKLAITGIAFSLLGIAYIRYRKSVGQEIVIALLFALFVTAYHPYIYSSNNIQLGHINIYPLLLWTASLVILREIYERMHAHYRLAFITVVYIIALFALEYVGYYVFNIQLAEHAPSLWGLGIMHGSAFLHWFYLLAGPLYIVVTDYLEVR